VTVCISGGVDSAVAALLLKRAGHEVAGLLLRVLPEAACEDRWEATLEAARAVCDALGIPLEVLDVSGEFEREVIDVFARGYAEGLTPNPCVICNPAIKWGLALEHAIAGGAEWLATGHYARIERGVGEGREPGPCLLRGVDATKDQSYMLCRLTRGQLARTILPLGGYTKEQVRRIAREAGLPVAERDESQDICFIPDGDHGALLQSRVVSAPGPIVDLAGNVLAEHRGLIYYTVGQRRGLGIGAEQRLFVIRKDLEHNALIVGPRQNALTDECLLGEVNWVSVPAPPEGETIPGQVEVRYRTTPIDAELTVLPEGAGVCLREPAVCAPGQAAVMYDNDTLLCGGTIRQR
jgi:tRNA-specific 2-thiouridylase